MQQAWSPSQSQITAAAGRQPVPCCQECAAANMGGVGFTFPTITLPSLPNIDQNTLLIGAGLAVAAVVGYSLMTGGRAAKGRRTASVKAQFAKEYADATGRMPTFK